jgi:hypothetical protein
MAFNLCLPELEDDSMEQLLGRRYRSFLSLFSMNFNSWLGAGFS